MAHFYSTAGPPGERPSYRAHVPTAHGGQRGTESVLRPCKKSPRSRLLKSTFGKSGSRGKPTARVKCVEQSEQAHKHTTHTAARAVSSDFYSDPPAAHRHRPSRPTPRVAKPQALLIHARDQRPFCKKRTLSAVTPCPSAQGVANRCTVSQVRCGGVSERGGVEGETRSRERCRGATRMHRARGPSTKEREFVLL